jgi:hypothetical protein
MQFLVLLAALAVFPAHAGDKRAADDPTGVWTLVIPESFPDFVYVWRINADGTYQEEGWARETGTSIQPTLTGRWTTDGKKLTLSQEGIPYVFEGSRIGRAINGRLYLNGKGVSRFCAQQGDTPPDRCDQSVATAQLIAP